MWIQIKLNPIASLVPKAARLSSIPVCCQRTYLKTNNTKNAWLPLNHKTVVCCFISYTKLSIEELFWVLNYAHFFFFIHLAILWWSIWQDSEHYCFEGSFLTVNDAHLEDVNTNIFKNTPFSVPCLPLC